MDLNDIIGRICPLPQVPAARIAECAETVRLPKGAMVVEAGRVETDIFFIANGIARAFVVSEDGRDVTFWIGAEGTALLSLRSYVQDRPGYENIQLMEDSRLYRLHRDDLHRLFREDVHIANWGRRFAEQQFLLTEERLIPMLCTTATRRYEHLLRHAPELLQRLPLEHLASWLGITPASLSRIRGKLR